MFGFFRKNKAPAKDTADTFVEATGGGWSNLPDAVPVDGGQHVDFIGRTLENAHAYALENNIPIGQEFEFTITNIPVGISSPHEIVFGLMMRAGSYGLSSGAVYNETASFARIE